MQTGKMDRRKFIKSAISGTTGMVLAASVKPGYAAPAGEENTGDNKFVYRTLGKTGLSLPVVSMGVMNADNPNLVKAALDAGIVHLDTAHGYQRGRNEEMIGQVIRGRSRDSFVIATKIPENPGRRNSEKLPDKKITERFLERLNISLRRLGLDFVDILYIHSLNREDEVLSEPLLEALEKARKAGKTRFVGFSTHSNEPEVLRAAVKSKFHEVVLTAFNFKQDHREEVRKAIAEAARAGIGIIAMKTMAGGYLDRRRQQPVNTRAALKWVLQHPDVTTTIPGCTTFDQLESNISVMADLTLDRQEKESLQLGSRMEGLYCQSCGSCLSLCRNRLPVPDMMRAYMYNYSYRNHAAAQDLLLSLDLPENPCGDCSDCPVTCRKGFDVSRKIRDIARLRQVPSGMFA